MVNLALGAIIHVIPSSAEVVSFFAPRRDTRFGGCFKHHVRLNPFQIVSHMTREQLERLVLYLLLGLDAATPKGAILIK